MIRKIFNCISIHNGGGITYLSLMHSELDKEGNLIFLDYRAKNNLKPFINAEIKYFKKNIFRNFFVLIERLKKRKMHRIHSKKFDKNEVFSEYYLNGLPPFIRFPFLKNKTYILFQNRNLFVFQNYFNKKLFFNFNFIVYHVLHSLLINFFLKRTDIIIVQTSSMKKIIENLKPNNNIIIQDNYWKNLKLKSFIDCIDFKESLFAAKEFETIKKISKLNRLFFYPADLSPHKNHKRLFKCFKKITHKNIKLIVTLDINEVPDKYKSNNQIIFLGKQSFRDIHSLYKIVDFLIFPSLNESLGLPLIESSLYKIPIIASDLDYVYDVCSPFITFNPFSETDIHSKVLESIKLI